MSTILSLLWSKFGAVLALLVGVVGMWLRMKFLKNKVKKLEAKTEAAKTETEILREDDRIDREAEHDKQEAFERIDNGGDFESEFNKLRGRQGNKA
jgi:hypothetical protein